MYINGRLKINTTMIKTFYLLLITACISGSAFAQYSKQPMDSVRQLSELDHKYMLTQLHIDTLRPGANGSGNPDVANAANYNEAKANPYPILPNPLILKNGQKVTTAKMWWQKRRPEIVEDFDREVYGRMPANVPKVSWEVISASKETNGDVPVINGAGLTRGIIGLVNKGQPRKPDNWGALRAWAWGASRALDYLETDKTVNAKAVGIEGHSRFGKAALVTMAYDPRFAISYISSSGEGGAKLHRRNAGEIVENLAASSEYHWMAGNFLKYAGPLTWNDLPVDSHELIGLCAPRPVFIGAGANGDSWADGRGMFMAEVAAGPVYTLLGKKDIGTVDYPAVGTSLIDGDMAFRLHSGGHTPAPNWLAFINFASRYLK